LQQIDLFVREGVGIALKADRHERRLTLNGHAPAVKIFTSD